MLDARPRFDKRLFLGTAKFSFAFATIQPYGDGTDKENSHVDAFDQP